MLRWEVDTEQAVVGKVQEWVLHVQPSTQTVCCRGYEGMVNYRLCSRVGQRVKARGPTKSIRSTMQKP